MTINVPIAGCRSAQYGKLIMQKLSSTTIASALFALCCSFSEASWADTIVAVANPTFTPSSPLAPGQCWGAKFGPGTCTGSTTLPGWTTDGLAGVLNPDLSTY